jgi:hypothetical protein
MNTNMHFLSYLAHFSWEWEIFQTKFVDKIKKTHFVFSNLYPQSCRSWDNVEKYGRAGQDKGGNMAHAHCMLDP